MRSVTVRLDDLRTTILCLGYVGENEHTRINIDAKKMYDQYPSASASLTVCPPEGESYPAVITRDGDMVIWDIADSDLVAEGSGEIQLSFTQGETVAKTFIGRFKVSRSLVPTGDIPSGLDDFLTRAGAALTAIPETIDEALAEAKASGEFDGADGQDGQDGADGFSPIATVTKSGNKATISITDANGTTTAEVTDGADGAPGQDGAPGIDGFSPRATVSKSGSTATITITDAAGTTTAQISDGDGADIIDDTAGAGDTDKVWSADKSSSLLTEINSIYNAIDYVSQYLVKNDDFENGLWANGTWRTDGNYGKYKSNKNGFELESFTVKVSTTSYTNLVISITCFDENNSSLGNFITNNIVIQSGSYAVTKTDILNSIPTAKYISIAIGKLSGSTYYDLPSDIVITVEKTNVPQTIADRVSALESLIGSGTSVVVAQNGGGDYNTIEDAVNGITDDSASKPYTILIKNGVYDEHIYVGGDRYLSFVGESRENCIIRSHTGMYTDAPLWIDGNFTIENLTLQMLDDEAPNTWTPGTSQSDPATMLPGYALHIDGGSSAAINSVYGYKLGVVRNCTLYSVAFPAIGAGLHANQKLVFDGCDFIRNTSTKYHTNQYQYYTNYSGSMIMHDSTHSGDANQNLEIINCRFICNLGKSATFRFKYGSPENVKYAMIDNTFWCAETSSSIVDSDIQGSVLLGNSHGNNNSMFNVPFNDPVSVSGTTPSITGVADTRYICGECATLSITAPASGCIDVVFESGSTPTVLTVSSAKTGVTAIKWANGFDPTALEANTTYEINILDGEFGVVGSWT